VAFDEGVEHERNELGDRLYLALGLPIDLGHDAQRPPGRTVIVGWTLRSFSIMPSGYGFTEPVRNISA